MYSSPIWFCTFSVEYITVIVASYNNDMASKFHIHLLTLYITMTNKYKT